MLASYFKLELARRLKQPSEVLLPVAFCLLVIAITPLGIGSEMTVLKPVAAGIVWIAVLLSSLLTLPVLFERNNSRGVLEQYCLMPVALEWIIAAQACLYWMVYSLPLLAAACISSLFLYYPIYNIAFLMLSLVLGTAIMTCLGQLMAALITGAPKAGLAASLLLLPLYVPVIIFCSIAAQKGTWSAELALAAGLLLFSLPVSCYLTAALLRRAQ